MMIKISNKYYFLLIPYILIICCCNCENHKEERSNIKIDSDNIFDYKNITDKDRLLIAKNISQLQIKYEYVIKRQLSQGLDYNNESIPIYYQNLFSYILRDLSEFTKSHTEIRKIYSKNSYELYVYYTYGPAIDQQPLIVIISNSNTISLLKGFSNFSYYTIVDEFFSNFERSTENMDFICKIYLENVEYDAFSNSIIISEDNYIDYKDYIQKKEKPVTILYEDSELLKVSYLLKPKTGYLCKYIFILDRNNKLLVQKDTINSGEDRRSWKLLDSLDSLIYDPNF